MNHYSLTQWAQACALIFGIFFIICLFWGYLIPDPALRALHMDILRMSLPGFAGMDLTSILIGLVESIVFGAVTGLTLASSLNIFAKK